MLIFSWNVAGLSKTVEKIDKQYGDDQKRRRNPSVVLGEFFSRHSADIVCIQEAKIPKSALESRSEPFCCAHVEGYESFWSCCSDASRKGFNGVVTYCKTGTVVAADAEPLDNPDLDKQGRCVMTDHGKFVIFNVYVPAGGSNPLGFKMKFLRCLRQAMKNQREKRGKLVILAGDLNISHTEKDVFWGSRKLPVREICEEVKSTTSGFLKNTIRNKSCSSPIPQWKIDLATNWPKITNILESKKTVEVETTNPHTNEKFKKHRMKVEWNGKQIMLGNHEEQPEYCEMNYDFNPWYYPCPETGEQLLCQEGQLVPVKTVAELMRKLMKCDWDQALQKRIASSDGRASVASPPRKWLNEIIHGDQMVDCFRFYYPQAEGRFTCWDQFKNKRYENQGARIDYILVDRALVRFLKQGNDGSLRCGGCNGNHDPNSEAAALCAATANGCYQPVAFHGGGIIEETQKSFNKQFGTSHTGHIYTPPSLSDHIGVSVLLEDSCASHKLKLNDQDRATKGAQPHKKARAITSYFARRTIKSELNGSEKQQTKRIEPKRSGSKRKGPMDVFLKVAKCDMDVKSRRLKGSSRL